MGCLWLQGPTYLKCSDTSSGLHLVTCQQAENNSVLLLSVERRSSRRCICFRIVSMQTFVGGGHELE